MFKEVLESLFRGHDVYIFIFLISCLIGLYFLIGRGVKNSRMANDQKRRTIANLRAIFILILLGTSFVLWADEFYQFIISIAALLAACAIAGKELFLCYGGSFYKTFARPFSVGDRITIGSIRGDVVDIGLMSTQLIEVGPKDYTQQLTGRTITIPNSQFLTTSIFNETDSVHDGKGRGYGLHVFIVPIVNARTWKKHKEFLLNSANEVCSEYFKQAKNFFIMMAKKRQVDIPYVEPRVNIRVESPEKILLIVRISVPIEMKGTLEQEILNSYLEKVYSIEEKSS